MWFCLKHNIKGGLQEDQESENQSKLGKHTSVAAWTSFSFQRFFFNVNFERLHFRNGGPGRGGCSLRQARPQERTPRPSHCALHPPNLCVKPPHTIWRFKWSFSRDLDSHTRRERPFAGLRPPASATATPLPWPRPGSLPNCPATPVPPARCGNCWSGWLAPRDQKSLMSPATC